MHDVILTIEGIKYNESGERFDHFLVSVELAIAHALLDADEVHFDTSF